jgi:IS30 family transposase
MPGRKLLLDAEQRKRILSLNRQGVSIDNLAVRFGMKRSHIGRVLTATRKQENGQSSKSADSAAAANS